MFTILKLHYHSDKISKKVKRFITLSSIKNIFQRWYGNSVVKCWCFLTLNPSIFDSQIKASSVFSLRGKALQASPNFCYNSERGVDSLCEETTEMGSLLACQKSLSCSMTDRLQASRQLIFFCSARILTEDFLFQHYFPVRFTCVCPYPKFEKMVQLEFRKEKDLIL